MPEQISFAEYPFYGGTPPHQQHSDTSRGAAVAVASKASKQRAQVYAHILSKGNNGATDEEIGTALDLGGNSVRPRRRELVIAGRVVDSGHRRKTTTGRDATVWVWANCPPEARLPVVTISEQLRTANKQLKEAKLHIAELEELVEKMRGVL
ncbi:MAG: hypothetical protein GY854_19690 [Deltaproteobacteria bacterium]|nr:hypothetical protein [Deltaproteobacteria bacterium]